MSSPDPYEARLQARLASARGEYAQQGEMFSFTAGGRSFLIDHSHVLCVQDASNLIPIPLGKRWCAGVADVQGVVHAVTDLSVLTGGPATAPGGKLIALAPSALAQSALLVDSVGGLVARPVSAVSRSKNDPDWVSASSEAGQCQFLIDAKKLSADPRFSKLQVGAQP